MREEAKLEANGNEKKRARRAADSERQGQGAGIAGELGRWAKRDGDNRGERAEQVKKSEGECASMRKRRRSKEAKKKAMKRPCECTSLV